MNPISKLLSLGEGRKLRKYETTAAKINALEPAMQALSDEELAALAGYLNAIPGRGAHVVTANDYLARRDAERIGRICWFLGILCSSATRTSRRRSAPTR